MMVQFQVFLYSAAWVSVGTRRVLRIAATYRTLLQKFALAASYASGQDHAGQTLCLGPKTWLLAGVAEGILLAVYEENSA